MAAGNKEDSLANLFELQDKERLLEIDLRNSGGTKYKGGESGALSVLNKLRLKGEAGFCDVILKVEGRQLTTHRCVLAANSPFFYTMLSSGMRDSNQKVLSLQSFSFTSMSLILDYFYTREIVINDENVLDLLDASSFLLVTPVKNACIRILTRRLDSDNCFSVLQIAQQFGSDELARKANEYIKTNFFIVMNNEEFVSISQKELIRFISSDDIQVEKEDYVYQCVLKWVKHDEANRVADLTELLKHLRKDSLPKGFLESEMEREPLLKLTRGDDDPCTKTSKEHGVKSVQELRPSTEIHTIMIGVKKSCPRKIFFYDLDKKECVLLSVASDLDCLKHIVLAGQTLYMSGRRLNSCSSALAALSFDDIKSAGSSAIKRKPLELTRKHKPFFSEWRLGYSVVNLNGLLYYIGGFNEMLNHCCDTVQCYHPKTDEWSCCTPMNMRRCEFGCVASEQNIYVIGGGTELDTKSPLSSVEKYDPESNSWSYVAPLEEAISSPGCVYLREKIYVIGGSALSGCLVPSCEIYSTLTNEWQTIAQLPYAFDGLHEEVIILENQITVLCIDFDEEDDDFPSPSATLQYDLQSNRWLEVKALGPSDKERSFKLCSMKLPQFIFQRIASEFCQADWDSES